MIMNQSSIDRGLFRSMYYRAYQVSCFSPPLLLLPTFGTERPFFSRLVKQDVEKRVGMQVLEEFEKPTRDNTLKMKHGTYEKLDPDGLISPGVGVKGEDIVIGKTAPLPQDSEELGQRLETHTVCFYWC